MTKQKTMPPAVEAKPFEVTAEECNGDISKMIRKFIKKAKKQQILQPLYAKSFYLTRTQKKRKKHSKAVFDCRRQWEKLEAAETSNEKK